MARTLKLTLPYPPSVNHYWRRGKFSTYLSEAGKKYRERAIAAIDEQTGSMAAFIDHDLVVSLKLHRRDRKQYDVDNYTKAVLDSLEHSGIIANDSQVRRLSVEKCEIVKGGKCEVTIIELSEVSDASE